MRGMTLRIVGISFVVLFAVGRLSHAVGDDGQLARELRLESLIARALDANPSLRGELSQAQAAQERKNAVGRLPEPELKIETWAVPLLSPLAFDRAFMHMVGVRQTFPAFGSRDAQQRVATEEAGQASDQVEVQKEDLILAVRRAFAGYKRVDKEYHLRLEYLGLALRIVEVTAGAYRAGGSSLADQLRLKVEISRIHGEIAGLEQDKRTAAATINTLIGRAPDAEIGPAFDRDPAVEEPAIAGLDRQLEASRPELRVAEKEIRKNEGLLDSARRQARWPMLMIGVEYMNMPMEVEHHGYGAMVSMGLPWLNPGRSATVRAAEQSRLSAARFLEAAGNQARLELRAAAGRLRAGRYRLVLSDRDLLPQARQSFEVTQAAYSSGAGDLTALLDSFRTFLQVRLDRARAVAEVELAAAELDRAVGRGRLLAENAGSMRR